MKMLSRTSLIALAAVFATPAMAQTYTVSSAADDGAGSLRAALQAAAETGGVVILDTEGDIEISTGLVYTGRLPLSIVGAGQTVRSAQDVTLLSVTEGADLTIASLNFEGPGGYSIEARADADGRAGKGIFVDLRDDQDGTVTVTLSDVRVADVAGHGIHVSDCSLADECGGGGGGAGEGAPASILLRLNAVAVEGVGYGRFDADGLRVDERDAGSIIAHIVDSIFTGVGADGVELDEGQAGDVIVHSTDTTFSVNGGYCDPAILSAFMPDAPEGAFEAGAMAADAIPGPVTGSPDDRCFEREVDVYDDGSVEEYEFAIDVDDGFDIDEAGPGSLIVSLSGAQIVGNLDEGLDLDEEDAGSIDMVIAASLAANNTDDGFKHSEEGAGDVRAVVTDSISLGNGGKGFVFEEEDAGDVVVTATAVFTTSNDDSDDTGLEVVQDDDGMGAAVLRASDLSDGVDADGVRVEMK